MTCHKSGLVLDGDDSFPRLFTMFETGPGITPGKPFVKPSGRPVYSRMVNIGSAPKGAPTGAVPVKM